MEEISLRSLMKEVMEVPMLRGYPVNYMGSEAFFFLPEDIIKIMHYKIDKTSDPTEKKKVMRILEDFQTSYEEKKVRTIIEKKVGLIMVQLGYATNPDSFRHTWMIDDMYGVKMHLYRTNRNDYPVSFLHDSGNQVMFSSQAVFHIFRSFVCGINWTKNFCPEHEECLEEYKNAIISSLQKYKDREKLYNVTDVDEEVAKLKMLCYYKYVEDYSQLWDPTTMTPIKYYHRNRRHFRLYDFSHEFIDEMLEKEEFNFFNMMLYLGFLLNFVGFQYPGFLFPIFDAIGEKVAQLVLGPLVTNFFVVRRRLKYESRHQLTYEIAMETKKWIEQNLPGLVEQTSVGCSESPVTLPNICPSDKPFNEWFEEVKEIFAWRKEYDEDVSFKVAEKSDEDLKTGEEVKNDQTKKESDSEKMSEKMSTLQISEVKSNGVSCAEELNEDDKKFVEKVQLEYSKFAEKRAKKFKNDGKISDGVDEKSLEKAEPKAEQEEKTEVSDKLFERSAPIIVWKPLPIELRGMFLCEEPSKLHKMAKKDTNGRVESTKNFNKPPCRFAPKKRIDESSGSKDCQESSVKPPTSLRNHIASLKAHSAKFTLSAKAMAQIEQMELLTPKDFKPSTRYPNPMESEFHVHRHRLADKILALRERELKIQKEKEALYEELEKELIKDRMLPTEKSKSPSDLCGPTKLAAHKVRDQVCTICKRDIGYEYTQLNLECTECSTMWHVDCVWNFSQRASLLCPLCKHDNLKVLPQ